MRSSPARHLPLPQSAGTMIHSRGYRLVRAGLLAGVVGGLHESMLSLLFYETVTRMWQHAAATLLLPFWMESGRRTAAVAVIVHFGAALAWSAVFLAWYERSPRLRNSTRAPAGVLGASVYFGVPVWIVMSLVVTPLLTHRLPAIGWLWWQFQGYIPTVGLPIAWSISQGAGEQE
jgi:hypothetical protein